MKIDYSTPIPKYWNYENQKILFEILNELSNVLFDIDNHINYGFLLGQIRDGKILDWDPDIDISVDYSKWNLMFSRLKKTNLKFYISKNKNNVEFITCFSNNGIKLNNKIWPFIDVFPMKNNVKSVEYESQYSINKKYIYPIKQIEYKNIVLNIPNNPEFLLDTNYPNWRERYIINIYSIKNENYMRSIDLKKEQISKWEQKWEKI